jgi:hypothetical protein
VACGEVGFNPIGFEVLTRGGESMVCRLDEGRRRGGASASVCGRRRGDCAQL